MPILKRKSKTITVITEPATPGHPPLSHRPAVAGQIPSICLLLTVISLTPLALDSGAHELRYAVLRRHHAWVHVHLNDGTIFA